MTAICKLGSWSKFMTSQALTLRGQVVNWCGWLTLCFWSRITLKWSPRPSPRPRLHILCLLVLRFSSLGGWNANRSGEDRKDLVHWLTKTHCTITGERLDDSDRYLAARVKHQQSTRQDNLGFWRFLYFFIFTYLPSDVLYIYVIHITHRKHAWNNSDARNRAIAIGDPLSRGWITIVWRDVCWIIWHDHPLVDVW